MQAEEDNNEAKKQTTEGSAEEGGAGQAASNVNQQEQQPVAAKTGAVIETQTTLTEAQRAKEKMQSTFKQLVVQLKQGCKKQFCFNPFCKKNLFGKSGLQLPTGSV